MSFVLKLIASVLLLAFVVYLIDFARVWATLNDLPWWYFVFAALFQTVLLLVVSLRWWIVSPGSSFARLTRVTFGSQHLMFLFPSSVTLDAVRLWSVRSDPSGIAGNIGAILSDKIAGLAAMLICFGISGLIADLPSDLNLLLQQPALFSLAGGIIMVAVLMFDAGQQAYKCMSRSHLGRAIASKIPSRIIDLSSKALLAGSGISRTRMLVNVCAAILYQLLVICGYWLMALVFDFQMSISQMLFISSFMQIVMLFPVSVAGIGLKDVSLVYALGLFGVESSVAFSASISGYPISVAFAIFGWMLSSKNINQRDNTLGL